MEIRKKVIPKHTIGKMKSGDTFECEGDFYQLCSINLPGDIKILEGKILCYNFNTKCVVTMAPGIYGNPVKLVLEEI